MKPDGYLNQQGAICARSSYWLRIVVVVKGDSGYVSGAELHGRVHFLLT
ncbi:hypothetical protein DENIT_80299 [Pseudomonas veronii]|nr:hypothetical protein DENIT_80299 [Pseudomonas veronii]